MNAPSHSINSFLVWKKLVTPIKIDYRLMGMHAVGADILIAPDFDLFERQHKEGTKDFFITFINYIKKYNLQNNPEVMACLYGHINHLVSDAITHPMIYYMTEGIKKDYWVDYHGLSEYLIDDYLMKKYKFDKEYFFYDETNIKTPELIEILSKTYEKVYGVKNEGSKYNLGILLTNMFHVLYRKNLLNIPKTFTKLTSFKDKMDALIQKKNVDTNGVGDLLYHNNIELASFFMNMDHKEWLNPMTGEVSTESFEDLFNKAVEETIKTIKDVNNYIYNDIPLTNSYILNNISYNTGLPCELGQNFKYLKKYDEEELNNMRENFKNINKKSA